jgi:hypothetical protein
MKTSDFMNKVTVESLQKDLRSKYGVSVDIAKYSKAQLESYSDKIKGKLKEFEIKHKFNESLQNDEYQKTLLISKIVESAINQFIDNPLEVADEEDLGEDLTVVDETDEAVNNDFVQEGDNIYHSCVKSFKHTKFGEGEVLHGEHTLAEDGTVSHYDAKFVREDGTQFIVRNIPVANMLETVVVEHGHASKKKKVKKEEVEQVEQPLKEGAEEKAELTMAAKDMVDRFTAFLEDVAEMGAEGMLELADSIRDELGQEQAEQFVATVKPALEQTQEVLTTAREALTAGVGIITGEGAPVDTIGADPEGDIEEPVAGDEPVEPIEPTDDFGASDAATGGTEPAGREKRESYQPRKQSIEESTRVLNKLAR